MAHIEINEKWESENRVRNDVDIDKLEAKTNKRNAKWKIKLQDEKLNGKK